jgi:hypothetical protein
MKVLSGFKFLNPLWIIDTFLTTYWMGGDPPAPAPTTSTSYTTNVPEYAEPYVMNMLNAAQAQIYNPSMTGFNPYVPYSNNPADYVASASPMQQQSYSTAANMQMPGQYGMATAGTLGAMGGLGGVGNQMGNAGMNYMNMATNPYATQAFMNPYLQASLAPQLQLANQQYDIAGQQQQSKAAQSGAFGGSREALMGGLNRQNQMLAQNQIIGQGYNRAFDAAQQAQQFGSNLGLQGQQGQLSALQAYLSGANQLAGIGGSQLAAQQGIANLQNQFGQQQQGQQQNIINQAVQNYATAQQYPFMQLGLLNSMLRGLPMQQSSTQMYQAPPNPLTQIAGLGAAAYGQFGGAGGKKDGGIIKAAGGIPMSRFNQEQLNKVQKSPYSTPLAKVVATGELGLQNYIKSNPESKNVFAQLPPPQQMPQQMPSPEQMAMMPQNRVGLDTIETDDMTQMAGGGLLAFVGGGDTSYDGINLPTPGPQGLNGIDPMKADAGTLIRQALLSSRPESDAAKAQREALEAGIKERESQMGKDKWTMLGLNLMAQTGPFALTNIGNAGRETLNYMATQKDLTDKDRKELLKLAVEQDKNELTRDDQLLQNLNTVESNKATKMYQIESLKIQKQAQEDAKKVTNEAAASKLWADTLSKNLLNARTNAARTNTEISEAEAYRQAHEETYNTLKATPMFKLLTDVTAPVPPAPPPPPPPKEPGLIDKAKEFFGGNKTVDFSKLPK